MHKKNKENLVSFENKMMALFEDGELPYMMHFCGGNENQLIEFFKNINEGDYILSTHRSHYHYLLAGATEEMLMEKVDRGDSMFIFDKSLNFLTSSVLAGTCCIAAGVALGIKMKNQDNHVWCFIGDGAEDEGHFYEAVKFVQSNNLPCNFIIEDNNRSVDSSKEDRGSTYTINWPSCVYRYNYTSIYPHAGTNKWIIFKNK